MEQTLDPTFVGEVLGLAAVITALFGLGRFLNRDRSPAARAHRRLCARNVVRYLLGWPLLRQRTAAERLIAAFRRTYHETQRAADVAMSPEVADTLTRLFGSAAQTPGVFTGAVGGGGGWGGPHVHVHAGIPKGTAVVIDRDALARAATIAEDPYGQRRMGTLAVERLIDDGIFDRVEPTNVIKITGV